MSLSDNLIPNEIVLFRSHTLSDEEFEAKKRELLART